MGEKSCIWLGGVLGAGAGGRGSEQNREVYEEYGHFPDRFVQRYRFHHGSAGQSLT